MNTEELKHIAVLEAMDSDALARLAAALEGKDYAEGEPVFVEGDPGDSMYFIARGCIRIEKRAQATGAVHKTLAVLEAGDYFGEMALLDQKPRSASAVAAGEARILRLSKAAFDEMQGKGNLAGMSMLFAMIRTSSERIRRLSGQVVVYDEVGKAIGESRDLQTLLDVILQQLSTALFSDWGLLVLRSQFSERLELRAEVNLTLTEAQREAVCNGGGFLGPVLQNPGDQLVASFEEQEPFKSCARLGFESASLLLSPITVEGQLLGLIVLGGNARDQFDLNGLNLARGVARQAGQAILNARHREEEQARSRHSRQFVRF
ncbi:MAG: cyclic nucleotide-binding domain-containing protein [Verrucomicrobia bacterium]|nr:cyclic nucleotide-binding domain-containing protein [Verrucomicrobiota bacterium]